MHWTHFVMLFIILLLSHSLAKGEKCLILANLANPLLYKDGDVIIGAVFPIHRGTQMRSLEYTEKPQALNCIRFVVVGFDVSHLGEAVIFLIIIISAL